MTYTKELSLLFSVSSKNWNDVVKKIKDESIDFTFKNNLIIKRIATNIFLYLTNLQNNDTVTDKDVKDFIYFLLNTNEIKESNIKIQFEIIKLLWKKTEIKKSLEVCDDELFDILSQFSMIHKIKGF